ncbi:MAG: TerB family tellurite resistance protein [Chitinophagaceae bacterium]|nr:TerB family tellurite resistance protein [Chitinophagaceae bacterium]
MTYNKIKRTGIVLLLCLVTSVTRAQSVAQLIEQLSLDIQKLSELKTILKDMQEGYQELNKGYINIRDIVKGNFNLHKTFLDGLLAVAPPVRQYYKVGAIIDKEKSIILECRSANQRWVTSGLFTSAELEYIQGFYKALSDRGGQCLDRLITVVKAGELRMSDAERMQAIDRVHSEATGLLEGLRHINDELSIQALQRAREQHNIQFLKSIYDNP